MKLMRYSGLITKTKAMRGKLLTPEQFRELTELATVSEAVNYLKETSEYVKIYQSHEGIWHRGQAEAVITDSLYQNFGKLYHFSDAGQRTAFQFVFFRYEVDLLKFYLKYLFRGARPDMDKYTDAFFQEHTEFSLEKVKKAGTVQELEQCLEKTRYGPFFTGMQGRGGYVDYAVGLDIFYYTQVFGQIRRMKRCEMKEVLLNIYGPQIDWLNIMWIYRSKRFYEQSPGAVAAWTIPCCYRLKKQELHAMEAAADIQEFQGILEKTGYFRGRDAYVQMEDEISYRKVLRDTYHRTSRKHPVSMAPVLQYIYEKELEISRLTTVIEGIRYQVPPKDIKDYILITA